MSLALGITFQPLAQEHCTNVSILVNSAWGGYFVLKFDCGLQEAVTVPNTVFFYTAVEENHPSFLFSLIIPAVHRKCGFT